MTREMTGAGIVIDALADQGVKHRATVSKGVTKVTKIKRVRKVTLPTNITTL